jgi:hypothetical protein
MLINLFYFKNYTSKIKSKQRSFLPRLFILTGTRFSHLHGNSKICTGTGHRLVCWVCGACLMAIFIWVRFNRHTKMAGKILNGAKRREGHSITLCSLFYLFLPFRSLAPYNCSEYSDLLISPQRLVLSHV